MVSIFLCVSSDTQKTYSRVVLTHHSGTARGIPTIILIINRSDAYTL